MHSKNVALAVLASALLSTTALAQSSPPASSPADSKSPPAATQPAKPPTISSMQSTTSPSTAPSTAMGQWRASKFVGLDVYNANNEKIGDINEMITDSSGKITTIVVGVGGFLGMGEHAVGLPFEQVKFVNEPVKSTTGSATTGTGSTATKTTTTTTAISANKDVPDHATINMSKDQLKALPACKYASDTSSSTTRTTTTSPAPATPPARSPAPPANPPK